MASLVGGGPGGSGSWLDADEGEMGSGRRSGTLNVEGEWITWLGIGVGADEHRSILFATTRFRSKQFMCQYERKGFGRTDDGDILVGQITEIIKP